MRALVAAGVTLLCGCTLIVGDPNPNDPALRGADLAVAASCSAATIAADPHNCGACGHDCTRLPGVDGTRVRCALGVCDLRDACLPGRAHCSANPDDGCETDLSSAAHCGACGRVCSGATPFCTRDAFGTLGCAGSCSALTPTQCGTSCVDTATDPQHCGSCTNACPSTGNTIASCNAGVCGTSCAPGFHACPAGCADDTSVMSCGTACAPCPAPANGHATCDGVGCGVACDDGFVPSGSDCVPATSGQDLTPASDLGGIVTVDAGMICFIIPCTALGDTTCVVYGCGACSAATGTCSLP